MGEGSLGVATVDGARVTAAILRFWRFLRIEVVGWFARSGG